MMIIAIKLDLALLILLIVWIATVRFINDLAWNFRLVVLCWIFIAFKWVRFDAVLPSPSPWCWLFNRRLIVSLIFIGRNVLCILILSISLMIPCDGNQSNLARVRGRVLLHSVWHLVVRWNIIWAIGRILLLCNRIRTGLWSDSTQVLPKRLIAALLIKLSLVSRILLVLGLMMIVSVFIAIFNVRLAIVPKFFHFIHVFLIWVVLLVNEGRIIARYLFITVSASWPLSFLSLNFIIARFLWLVWNKT